MTNIKDIEIPEGWKVHKLGDLGIFKTSSVDKKINNNEEEIFLLNYMDVYKNNFIDNSIKFMKVTSDKQKILKSNVLKGDMFFTPSSETTDDIGYSTVVLKNIDKLLYSYHLVRLRFNQDINLRFKGFFCNSEFVLNQFSRLCTGSTRFTLGLDDFNNTKVLLPQSLTEQQKIAKILSTVDEAIQKTDDLIEKYKKIKTGLMEDLFTKGIDINTGKPHTKFKDSELGRIPESWEVKELGEVCEINMGQSPDGNTYNEDGFGLPFFQGCNDFGEINPIIKYYTSSPTKIANLGDILMSVRAPVGELNIANKKSCIGRGLCSIKYIYNISNNSFLYYLLFKLENILRKQSQGSTFEAINKNDLNIVKIKFPKSLQEQQKIAEILSSADEKIEKEQAYKQKLENIKKGLMNDLLTGKVRVKY